MCFYNKTINKKLDLFDWVRIPEQYWNFFLLHISFNYNKKNLYMVNLIMTE